MRSYTTTVAIEYRGIWFNVHCMYDEADPMRYEHLSIRPRAGDGADFLDYYRNSDEWPEVDRLIDQQMQEFIAQREAADIDRQMADAEEAQR